MISQVAVHVAGSTSGGHAVIDRAVRAALVDHGCLMYDNAVTGVEKHGPGSEIREFLTSRRVSGAAPR